MMERHTKGLSPSCTACAEGKKLVLFVTGVCDTGCFYCPLSDVRNHNPAMYANERLCLGRTPSELAAQVIEEARAMGATGMGVTGGDPMLVPELTGEMIRAVKEVFGPTFDVHLYTSKHPSRQVLEGLRDAGLNEIRFHPHESHWMRLPGSPFERAMRDARELGMRVGFEVPAIPGAERGMHALLDFARALPVDYVNLNELEYTHTNGEELARRNLTVLEDGSAGIAGSKELALNLVKEYGAKMPMHYCSSRFKDAVQLTNRVRRRAELTARPMDLLSEDGLIVVGVIESREPAATANRLIEEFEVPQGLIAIDPIKSRVEVAAWVLEEIADALDEPCFVIERYPTSEALEVERTPLN
jgi:uncharacterized protein